MDGEMNGTQETQEQQADAQGQQAQEGAATGAGVDAHVFEAQIAERDAHIAKLEGQIADAAKSAEVAKELRAELKRMKKQAEDDRVEFGLKLAGCRNVKAARAVLDDYKGDIDAMKEAEPWLFAQHAAGGDAVGSTGLPNAGAATDESKEMKHWREVAGLEDE